MNNEQFIWAEKYRPTKLEDFVGNDTMVLTIKEFLKKGQIPHFLFYGSPGTGKTSLAKTIAASIDADVLYINASFENRVDDVREKIQKFVETTGFKDLKVLILDEADRFSPESQEILRNILETFALGNRFILTCNYHERLIPAIKSRFQIFEVKPTSKKDIAVRLKHILDNEKVTYEIMDIANVVNSYYPDIRRMINYCQQCSVTGKFVQSSSTQSSQNFKEKLVSLLKDNANFTDIRQFITDTGLTMFDELYAYLYEKVADFAPKKQEEVLLTLGEWSSKAAYNPNKELVFMACILNIQKIIYI